MKLVDDDSASIGMFGSNESFGVIETESFLYEDNSPLYPRRLVLSLLVRWPFSRTSHTKATTPISRIPESPGIQSRATMMPGLRGSRLL